MNLKEWNSGEVTIKVDYDKCAGHGDCADGCPSSVYAVKDGKAVPVNIEGCIQCCACVQACPEQAIIHSACE
jgi:NAD-dependent dihydropyrimidine dehydrogenase PreA subunit